MSRREPAPSLQPVALNERRLRAARASGGTSAEPIYRAALAAARSLGVSGHVLDFGAGTGVMIERLLASDFSGTLTGADLLPRPPDLPTAVRWLQADLNEPLAVRSCAFDAIVSVEVIEHLENPRAVFREFHRLLSPGGHLLLSTPNQESLRAIAALVTRGHFVDFLDGSYPAHITALVRRDFARIAAETGFEPPRFLYGRRRRAAVAGDEVAAVERRPAPRPPVQRQRARRHAKGRPSVLTRKNHHGEYPPLMGL